MKGKKNNTTIKNKDNRQKNPKPYNIYQGGNTSSLPLNMYLTAEESVIFLMLNMLTWESK